MDMESSNSNLSNKHNNGTVVHTMPRDDDSDDVLQEEYVRNEQNKVTARGQKRAPEAVKKSNNDMGIFKFMAPQLTNKKTAGNFEDPDGYTDGDQEHLDLEHGRYTTTDEMFEEDELVQNSTNLMYRIQTKTFYSCKKYSSLIWKILAFLCVAGYTIYFGFAISNDVDQAMALIIITMVVLFLLVYVFIRDHFGETINAKCWEPLTSPLSKYWDIIQWILYPCMIIFLVIYLAGFVIVDVKQLQSLSGIFILILFTYATSKYPGMVNWRPVIWGYALQFLLAIFVLRWDVGYEVVLFLSKEITKFINYSMEGAATVYGDPWMIFHAFAFIGGAMIIYMGAVMSILYYYGITQICASKMAWLMQKTMGTTAIETLGVSANIFLNGMDTMLMLRVYLDKLTPSEFHTFLVGGHSTVAGFVFGLFVLFGAPPQHLLSAAVMSAPAVIAITKLNYPETRKSITANMADVKLQKGGETNVFEACASGAAVAGKTVAAVMINYIAFISILAFLNSTLSWLGALVDYPELSFEIICSYLFWPVALMIGVESAECLEVAKLIGIKVFTTEILAYQQLGVSAKAGLLNERSQTLATYALCGFCSLSTLAVGVGIWNVVCPQRTKHMANQMFRALLNANMACFMTASIAGLMYRDYTIDESEAPAWISAILGIIPSFKDLMGLVPGFT